MPRRALGGTFAYTGVAEAYRHRPPYPDRVFELCAELIDGLPGHILDLGAGEGALARRLAGAEFDAAVEQVDAVDMAAEMIAAGRRRPGGDSARLRWILGNVCAPELAGPYGLVVAGASLHWMDLVPTMTRLAELTAPGAHLLVVYHGVAIDVPWRGPLVDVIRRHSRARDWDPDYSVITELTRQELFVTTGHEETDATPYEQSVADYVESFHSTATLAREHMPTAEAAEFDASVRGLVEPYAEDGTLTLPVAAELTWGRPTPPTR